MNNINMIVELCAEDRARLDKILEELRRLFPGHPVERTMQEIIGTPATVEENTPEPAAEMPEAPAEVAEDLPFPEPQEVSAEDLVALVRKLAAVSADKREACKGIVKKYADNVSSVPADKRREVMDQLLDLAQEG